MRVVIEMGLRNYDPWGGNTLVSTGQLPLSDPWQMPHFDPKAQKVIFTLQQAKKTQQGESGIILHLL
jgi:hypothetical protein